MDWLLVNPFSGAGRAGAAMGAVRRALDDAGITVTEKTASTMPEIHDIAVQAVQAAVDRLWVLGGDGTIATAAGALCYSRTVLCPLAGGTASVFCRELSIPIDPVHAIRSLSTGMEKTIDVGQVNGTRFLLMASIGIDAQTVRDVNLNLKRWVGPLAYLIEAVRQFLSYSPTRVTVTDEHGIDRMAFHAIVLNARLYGGALAMAPAAKLDDGRFDVILIKKPGRMALLKFVFAIPSVRHLRLPYVEYFRSHTVNIRSTEAVSLQADGDCLARLPAEIKILPKALRVRAPVP